MLILLALLASVLAYDADAVVSKCVSAHRRSPDATGCVVRELGKVSEQQMSTQQYLYIADLIERRGGCRLIVFGVGGDSPIWLHANRKGETVFIEDSDVYASLARDRSKGIVVHEVSYKTKVRNLRAEADDVDANLWDFMPLAVSSTPWDVVLIDAPIGFGRENPGRLQPVWWASRMAARAFGHNIDVFLHDHDREAERFLGREMFTIPFNTQPLIVSSPNRNQHLAHWRLDEFSQNSIARLVGKATYEVKAPRLPILRIHTPGHGEEFACFEDMYNITGKSINSPTGLVDFRYTKAVMGRLPFGDYKSSEFKGAARLKSLAVRTAARLGFPVLMVDADILFLADLPWSEFSDLLARFQNVHLIAQQDYNIKCQFTVNSGFYVARASTWTARFLTRVLRISERSESTEQNVWRAILMETYESIFKEKCIGGKEFMFHEGYNPSSGDESVALLPLDMFRSGFLLRHTDETEGWSEPLIAHFNFIVGNCAKRDAILQYKKNN